MKMFVSVILSLILVVVALVPMLTPVKVEAKADENGKDVSRALGDEGLVLLKNDNNALPLQKGESVALFGEGQHLRLYTAEDFKTDEDTLKLLNSHTHATLGVQHGYVPWGAGSSRALGEGGVNAKIDPLDAFKEAHSNGEIKLYEEISKGYIDALENSHSEASYKEYIPTDSDYKKASENADTAICFIRRWDGECVDMKPKDWDLTESEISMLKNVTKYFKKVVVVLNTPAPMDTSWAKGEIDGIRVDSLIFAGYGGMQGGLPICDVILGRVNPSGKLATTYAKTLEDYPTTETFVKDRNYQKYTEDIFLGYRYFETFNVDVNYEFGFGLSYTDFNISFSDFKAEGTKVTFNATVENTGEVAGKEVVQIYLSAPQGKLGKASKVLCAFQKTRLLNKGQKEVLSFSIDLKDFASFDDLGKTGNKSAYVLEEGEYTLLGGNSVKNVKEVGKTELQFAVVEQLTSKAPTNLDKRLLADGTFEELPKPQKAQKEKIEEAPDGEGKLGHLLYEVGLGTYSMDDFVNNMTNSELATFFISHNGARIGADKEVNTKYGLVELTPMDGPSGLGSVGTSFPCETIIACTFNTELVEAFGLIIGKEAFDGDIDIWLAPGMNLHRCPIAGRNSEYYSEDPYLSGVMGMTTAKAAQSMGISVCIKHFVLNEKETNKLQCDSRVSERALREIYLKPFEMSVKGAKVNGVMSSYNYVNGVPASANKDILTGILRDEWGFEGYVSGDWNNTKNHIDEINAGNTVREPASFCDINVVLEAIEKNEISRETLIEGAKDVLHMMLRSKRFYDVNRNVFCGENHNYDEFGRCTKCQSPDYDKHANLSTIIDELLNDEPLPEEEIQIENDNTDSGNDWIAPVAAGGAALALGALGTAVAVKKKKSKTEE